MLSSLKQHLRINGPSPSDKGLYYPVALTSIAQADDVCADPDSPQPVPGRDAEPTFQSFAWSVAKFLLKTTIVCFAIYGVVHALSRTGRGHSSKTSDRRSCNCGHSLEEAKALGCSYDPIAVAWLPPHCRDATLAAEFATAGPGGGWRYTDALNSTRELGLDDIAKLPKGSFFSSSMRWHVAHCAYVWLKLQRAERTGVVVERRFHTEEHVRHCLDIFLDRRPLDAPHQGFGVTTMADGEPDTPVKHIPVKHKGGKADGSH